MVYIRDVLPIDFRIAMKVLSPLGTFCFIIIHEVLSCQFLKNHV